MAGGIPENEFNLSQFVVLGGFWTFEPWGVGSGVVNTKDPPPLKSKVYLFDPSGDHLLFTARVTRQQYDHKLGLYKSELKDAMSAVFSDGVEFEGETSDDIMDELAVAVDEGYSGGGAPAS